MLDFAIFAVTFLLALVGAVLYLYPVTAGSASVSPASTSPCPRRAAGGGPGGGAGRAPAAVPAQSSSGACDASRARAGLALRTERRGPHGRFPTPSEAGRWFSADTAAGG